MQGLPGKKFMDEMTAVLIYHKQSFVSLHSTEQTLAKNYCTEYFQNSEWLGKNGQVYLYAVVISLFLMLSLFLFY